MFVIRRAQMQAFEASAISRLEEAVRLFLAQTFPTKTTQLRSFNLRLHIDSARSYGFVSERDIAIYVTLAFQFSPLFPKGCSWAQGILDSDGATFSQTKLDRLLACAYTTDDEARNGRR